MQHRQSQGKPERAADGFKLRVGNLAVMMRLSCAQFFGTLPLMKAGIRFLMDLAATASMGFLGGTVLAGTIFVFLSLTIGLNYPGEKASFLSLSAAFALGLFYGAPVGLVVAPLLRLILFRLALRELLPIGLAAGGAALVIGCAVGVIDWQGNCPPMSASLICLVLFILFVLVMGFGKLSKRSKLQC